MKRFSRLRETLQLPICQGCTVSCNRRSKRLWSTLRNSRTASESDICCGVARYTCPVACLGYYRIQGALANLGPKISDQTVGKILKAYGIEPAPERKRQSTWKTFLKAHWDVLGAIDFTTIEVWTKGGLVTFYLLFVIEFKTRRVHFAGHFPFGQSILSLPAEIR